MGKAKFERNKPHVNIGTVIPKEMPTSFSNDVQMPTSVNEQQSFVQEIDTSEVSAIYQKGIPANRIQNVSGKGDSDPIADNSTQAGKAQNRRAVITFLK